jgi:hypothetical protein
MVPPIELSSFPVVFPKNPKNISFLILPLHKQSKRINIRIIHIQKPISILLPIIELLQIRIIRDQQIRIEQKHTLRLLQLQTSAYLRVDDRRALLINHHRPADLREFVLFAGLDADGQWVLHVAAVFFHEACAELAPFGEVGKGLFEGFVVGLHNFLEYIMESSGRLPQLTCFYLVDTIILAYERISEKITNCLCLDRETGKFVNSLVLHSQKKK